MSAGAATLPCPLAVVMPSRNQAAFIAQAVDSVFAQGVPGLQLFVQDGASTDGTPALLAALAQRHAGLHWVSEPDAGPSDALNRAFARALAETDAPVLGWLNSDDLYTPGAAARALKHLQQHPQQVLVYGEGEHIAADGAPLGRYPTRGPDTPLAAWADGCPICQPSVFLRREALLALAAAPGPWLDTTLRTAFDFELWLRLWKTFPGRVGQVPEVQALSRLHDAGITLSQREQVALEGLRVVSRHIGPAPGHWLLTHFHELMRELPALPARARQPSPGLHMLALLEDALPWLSGAEADSLRRFVLDHPALQTATAKVFADIDADGWARAGMALRSRGSAPLPLLLQGRHSGPQAAPLELHLSGAGGVLSRTRVPCRGSFEWRLQLPPAANGGVQHWRLGCSNPFVPAATEAGSSDVRSLAFLVTGLQVLA